MAQYGEPDAEITTIENYENASRSHGRTEKSAGFCRPHHADPGDAAEVLKNPGWPVRFYLYGRRYGTVHPLSCRKPACPDKNGVLITDNVLQDGDVA